MAKKSIHDLQLDIENEEHYLAFLKNSKADCSSDIQRGVVDEQVDQSKKRINNLRYTLKSRTNHIESQPFVHPTFEALDSYETEAMSQS